MTNPPPEQALEQARSAAALAKQAAELAEKYAEQAAHAAGAATGVDPTVFRLAIFVLAVFVGYYVVWNVTAALHTPLMSVTNAVSGIILVGAITQLGTDHWAIKIIATGAVLIASINVFGGFTVTQRMLKMFRKG